MELTKEEEKIIEQKREREQDAKIEADLVDQYNRCYGDDYE